ncbi:hypothetical protein [Nocardia sp. NPDC127526]|uniref:hypothetical protein n=1 Tax=Nocardia sp. NPDC127526 TaxID=3345393 RepID=UPI00363C0F3E
MVRNPVTNPGAAAVIAAGSAEARDFMTEELRSMKARIAPPMAEGAYFTSGMISDGSGSAFPSRHASTSLACSIVAALS